MLKLVLFAVGAVALAAGLIWATIVGFYAEQAPIVIGLLAGGSAVLWVAGRLPSSDAATRRTDA